MSLKIEWRGRIWLNEEGNSYRKDGPAGEFYDGNKYWYDENQRLHREDGPAIEMGGHIRDWCWHGERMTEEEWNDIAHR